MRFSAGGEDGQESVVTSYRGHGHVATGTASGSHAIHGHPAAYTTATAELPVHRAAACRAGPLRLGLLAAGVRARQPERGACPGASLPAALRVVLPRRRRPARLADVLPAAVRRPAKRCKRGRQPGWRDGRRGHR